MARPLNYARFAKQLVSTSRQSVTSGRSLLEKTAPYIVEQIEADSLRRGPLSFWGRSLNVDELTDTTVVDSSILRLIAEIARREVSLATPHAGLQHTYGYLFSTIETPYGFKRERWLETNIESAFDLDLTSLSPRPHQGTLLSNATWLAGQIAFRRITSMQDRLNAFLKNKIADDLLDVNVSRYEQLRLLERVNTKWRNRRRSWTLQTDLVTASSAGDFSLLVYSVIDHTKGTHDLVTLFPVGVATRQQLIDQAAAPKRDDLRTRYNAYMPALKGQVFSGNCRLIEYAGKN